MQKILACIAFTLGLLLAARWCFIYSNNKKEFFCFLFPFNECYENSNKMLIKFNINIPLCESIEALVNQQEQKRICIEILIMSGRGFP